MFHIEMFPAISSSLAGRRSVPLATNPLEFYFFAGCAVGGMIPFNRKYTACAP